MTMHQRQLDELRSLCRSGQVARAVDLAFEHFARFGRDDQVLAWLTAAFDGVDRSHRLGARLAELAAVPAAPATRSGRPGTG